MVECKKAALQFLVSHEELAEAIEPTVADLNDPAPCFLPWVSPLVVGFLASINDMRNVVMFRNDLCGGFAAIARISAQMLAAPQRRCLALDRDGLQHRIKLGDVVLICPCHDDRQRDATPVHQQMALASIFSPDPLDWGRLPLVPRAL